MSNNLKEKVKCEVVKKLFFFSSVTLTIQYSTKGSYIVLSKKNKARFQKWKKRKICLAKKKKQYDNFFLSSYLTNK